MAIKGWAIAGENPPPEVSKDGISADFGGNTWDIRGKLPPVTLTLKHDLRRLITKTPEWDQPMSSQARTIWLQHFEILEQTRSFIYVRCNRPPDALRLNCRLWILVDAAEWGMIVTCLAKDYLDPRQSP